MTIERDYEDWRIEDVIEHYENKIEVFKKTKELLDILRKSSNSDIQLTCGRNRYVVEVHAETIYEEMEALAMHEQVSPKIEYNPEDDTYSMAWEMRFW